MTRTKVSGRGPAPADIMIVGEAPGEQEIRVGTPFIGPSGKELTAMLDAAKLSVYPIYFTNICKYRPPHNDIKHFLPNVTEGKRRADTHKFFRDRWCSPEIMEGLDDLATEIFAVQPKIIIALGDTALWGLTGQQGITKWRGSYLETLPLTRNGITATIPVMPSYHPAAILRMWAWRHTGVVDLQRAAKFLHTKDWPTELKGNFEIRPTLDSAIKHLTSCRMSREPVVCDIETRGGYMTCVGFSPHKEIAMCIPFVTETGESYWTGVEETLIRKEMKKTLTESSIVMQNGIYDCQYFIREMAFCPNVTFDTMLAQHVIAPGTPKGLDYLASLYCRFYKYWKQESKEWVKGMPVEQLWTYNTKDCSYTYEVMEAEMNELTKLQLWPQFRTLMDLYAPVLAMMTKGFRQTTKGLAEESWRLGEEMKTNNRRLDTIFGHPVNPRSPVHLSKLFYKDFGVKPVINRKTGRSTLNEAALTNIAARDDTVSCLLRRPIEFILAHRQAGVLKSTFCDTSLAADGRFHTSFNIGGTETFRFSSSANGFGEGTNGQNIPPRIRKFLLPDPGYEIQDWDFEQADARVVAWDSGCVRLKEIFNDPSRSIHIENCRALFPREVQGWSDEAIKASQVHESHYKRYYFLAKTGVHAVNYLVMARTLGRTLGLTTKEAQKFIDGWLDINPEIGEWHSKVSETVQTKRMITNAFGFRRVYFDRIDVQIVQQALAWIGQSTVAIAIIKAMQRVYDQWATELDLLLQVHDSLVIQVPLAKRKTLFKHIHEAMQISIPYADPLILPVSMNSSEISWGDCK